MGTLVTPELLSNGVRAADIAVVLTTILQGGSGAKA